jgi:Ser/Thr protein kinase RdoA (MazF antagonist)
VLKAWLVVKNKIYDGVIYEMRYGIDNSRQWIKKEGLFPVQSSVLDEEELFSEIVKDFCIADPVSCRFLSRGDSDIYRVKTSTCNYYLKIYRPPKSLELSEAEAIFVSALLEAGIQVVKPVPRRDGSFAYQVCAPEGIRAMLLYEEAPPPLPSKLDEEMTIEIGEKIALFHNITDELDTSFGLPEIDITRSLDESIYYTRQFLSEQESTYLEEVSIGLTATFQKRARNRSEYGLCHADLVLSNIRLTNEGIITLFDFGNAMRTWRAFEFAVLYWSLGHRYEKSREKLWKAFLRGYQSIRPLPETLSEDLPAMLILRQMGFIGGNCATLPLRLGTEPLETGFIEREMKRLKALVDTTGILRCRK